jgi:hypothetical protein
MRGLIVYEGRDGHAEQIARALLAEAAALGSTAELVDLGSGSRPLSLARADFIFVGQTSASGTVSRRMRTAIRRVNAPSIGWTPVCVFDTFGPFSLSRDTQAGTGSARRGVGPLLRDLLERRCLNVHHLLIRCERAERGGPLAVEALERARTVAGAFLARARRQIEPLESSARSAAI